MPLSPNFGPRRDGLIPQLVVIHYTAMQSCAAARDRLCDPEAEVSAHYLIDYDGTVTALVDESARAWHAGAGTWAGQGDINSRSIGIELANTGAEPFAAPQMNALESLLGAIMARWPIPAQGVIGHSDMAPGRKSDPGGAFDWRRLALQGLSVWPGTHQPLPADPAGFLTAARRFGYPVDDQAQTLHSFRLRFRPWARGPLDGTDMALITDLATRFPVDAPQSSA